MFVDENHKKAQFQHMIQKHVLNSLSAVDVPIKVFINTISTRVYLCMNCLFLNQESWDIWLYCKELAFNDFEKYFTLIQRSKWVSYVIFYYNVVCENNLCEKSTQIILLWDIKKIWTSCRKITFHLIVATRKGNSA